MKWRRIPDVLSGWTKGKHFIVSIEHPAAHQACDRWGEHMLHTENLTGASKKYVTRVIGSCHVGQWECVRTEG